LLTKESRVRIAAAIITAIVLLLVALVLILDRFPELQQSRWVVALGIFASITSPIVVYEFFIKRSLNQGGINGKSGQTEIINGQALEIKGNQQGTVMQHDQRGQTVHGPQTNIDGSVQGPVLSGQIDGPVAAGAGDAVDLRGSIGPIYKPSIIQREKLPVPRVPPPPQDFTGRGEELEEILKSFDRGATITGLRGTGGIGKTALALVMVDRLKSRFPDGQIFLKLEGTSPDPLKPAEAMAQVIRAFRGSEERLPEDQNELQGLYNSVLEGKRILLLLDNAADDKQVIPLLPPKGCAALVTSRQNFTLPGMPQPFSLDTMKPEEARDLLLKISPHIGDRAEELARLCGHLPLALRAAASFLAVKFDLKPSVYLEALRSERTRLEKIGREGVDLDLEACFDLSYSRLPAETARVFCMLSVFPSDFDAAAEEVICQDEGHQHLSELLRWSLVEFPKQEGEGRYHLHDLVRLFALSLQDGDKDLNLRHATYYQELLWKADRLLLQGKESTHRGLQLFDQEWTNIQRGQNWTATNADEDLEAARICSNFAWAGNILNLRLHPQENVRWLLAALYAARRIESKEAEAAHLGNLGVTYRNLGEPCKAIEFYERALTIARKMQDNRNEGIWLGNLGLAYADLGETRQAIEFYERALAIAQEIGDRRSEGADLGNLGLAYADLGETRKAIEFYEQQLVIIREIRNRRSEGNALGNLGIAYENLGEPRKAIEYHEQALAIAREIGDRRGEGADLGNLGLAYADLGETRKAIEYHEQALAIVREIGDRRGEGADLGNLGNAYLVLGETRKAIEFYEQQLVITREIGNRRGEGNALWNMSLALDKLDNRARAIDCARAALKIREEIEDPRAEKVKRQLQEWESS
jgi:tetratricopeptide (TPR) repeat protein